MQHFKCSWLMNNVWILVEYCIKLGILTVPLWDRTSLVITITHSSLIFAVFGLFWGFSSVITSHLYKFALIMCLFFLIAYFPVIFFNFLIYAVTGNHYHLPNYSKGIKTCGINFIAVWVQVTMMMTERGTRTEWMNFYLERRSLGLAGINRSLIGCRWDLEEEELFRFCQVILRSAVSAWKLYLLQLLKYNPHTENTFCTNFKDFFFFVTEGAHISLLPSSALLLPDSALRSSPCQISLQ